MYIMYVTRHTNKFIKSARATQPRRLPVIDFQNEIAEMYVKREGVEEGVEKARGRRFIRWTFNKRLGANNTTQIVRKLQQNVNSAFIFVIAIHTSL